jgi:tetratricopeptide (TPR) repeat protein
MGGLSAIAGHVDLRGADSSDLQVLLIDTSGNATSAEVSIDGSFSFSAVACGEYEVRLADRGRPVLERPITVDDIVERLALSMPRNHRADGADDSVSLSELQHKPPAQALKEAQKGQAELRKGKAVEAIAHFERAVEIDARFAAVQGALARLYLQRHDYARAVPHLEALLKERNTSVWAWANLSAARFRLGHIEEAEAAARKSLALEPAQPIGRYILGISLASLNEDSDEALNCLRESFGQFPQGHLAAAKILAGRGDIAGARTELERYLSSHPAGDLTAARAWLDQHPEPKTAADSMVPGR